MKLRFKSRIAVGYMLATAIIIAVVYCVVFFIVQRTVYYHIDSNLALEAQRHATEVLSHKDIHFMNKQEWEQKEHQELWVNPIFIQITDTAGHILDKSPNLKHYHLDFQAIDQAGDHFNSQLNQQPIRQVQLPIEQEGEVIGFMIAAMSLVGAAMVIQDLQFVLLVSYPVVLLILFFASRFMAGKSILPVTTITTTTQRITRNNLSERVPLPYYKDELYHLSEAINELLQRMETAVERERQFTSDASHELRTPLSTLRGTLEVLIRHPRSQAEYEAKISEGLYEIDRMGEMVEQLLMLARMDAPQKPDVKETKALVTLVDEVLHRHREVIFNQHLKVDVAGEAAMLAEIPAYHGLLILENIITNAIKYSKSGGALSIGMNTTAQGIVCAVKDEGIGIAGKDIPRLFNPFFRSDALNHKNIGGHGLGLSIAHKAAHAIGATIEVQSKLGQGSEFRICFLRES